MAESYSSLEGTLDAHDTLEGEMNNHDDLTGEIQFSGGVSGVNDVLVNEESVVDTNKVAHIDLTPYAEKEDVYDKQTIDTALEGKADTDDIPTALSQLDNDDNYVQDADYVHTDNNFTDEDKAAIGGIPENITDLSDVEVSNIQNEQVLKWDATQEKFVNANESGGGSGDVADVKVNDTSVVDENGVANIDLTGYAETSDIPTDLADLSDDSTHRLVTDTEKAGWDAKADTSDIPTVNNNTITIQKNGQNVDTFSLNQTTDKVIDIAVPTKTSDLQNDNSFITNTVNNLANYYLKSDTYTQTEVNNLISAAVNGRFEKVTTLPASGEPNVIYLVPKTTALTNNVYDEYIWQDNAWELLGSTEIDLSNYVTTTDLSTALADYVTSSTFNTTIANYYTKTEVGNLLNGKVDKVSGKGLSTNDYDNTAKGIVDGVTNALAGKVDKVNGKGLSTEDYTTTEKNKLAGISTNANKVEASTTNGNIKIDGTETQVYDGSGKADKVSSATNGNLAGLDGSGNLTDSGWNGAKDTTSISGNPISISGLKSNQLAINPIITFEPIQAGSGTPSPSNKRAISGYDKIEVLSCGKNLLQKPFVYYDDITRNKANSFLIGAGTYTFSFATTTATSWRFCVSMFDENGNALTDNSYCPSSDMQYNSGYGGWINKGNRTYKEITLSIVVQCYIRITFCVGDTSSSTTMTNAQLEQGNQASTYEAPNKTTSISESLGQTVYGMSYYPRTGEAVITWGYIASYAGETLPSEWISDRDEYVSGTTPTTGAEVAYKLVSANYTIIQLTPHEISLLKDYAYLSTNGTSIALDYHNGELASLGDVAQLSETVERLTEYIKGLINNA